MRVFWALAALSLAGPTAAFATPVCEDEYASCKETCALEWGGSAERRDKLALCFNKCALVEGVCEKRRPPPPKHPPAPPPKSAAAVPKAPAKASAPAAPSKPASEAPAPEDVSEWEPGVIER